MDANQSTLVSQQHSRLKQGILKMLKESELVENVRFPLTQEFLQDKRKDYLPFIAGQGLHVGFIHPKFAEELKRFPGIFTFSGDKAKGQMVQLNRTLITEKDCTASVEGVMQILANEGKIHSWRNEKYPVVTSFGSPSLFWLERACVPYLGTKAYHTHLNGYTIVDGEMFLWVSIRGDSKMHQDFPGKYDHLVAGGQVGLQPFLHSF